MQSASSDAVGVRITTDSPTLGSESGLTLVMFGLWLIVIIGFGAFALDTSRIYNEHSELRNGADAAALAVAADCAQHLCSGYYDEYGVAESYADPNARDGATTVDNVDIDLTNRQVTVNVLTEDTAGDNDFDMVLAQVVGFEAATVQASATVRWGTPEGLDAIPLMFSKCEWDTFGAPGFTDEDPLGFLHRQSAVVNGQLPPTLGYPHAAKFVTIYVHGSAAAGNCPGSPSGQDLPGGFGWLDPDSDCTIPANTSGSPDWQGIDPGASPPVECSVSEMRDWVGTVQMIPYFNDSVGTGQHAEYQVHGFGALYITGYNFGGQYKEDSLITGTAPCTGNDRCIQGYMIGDWITTERRSGLTGGDYGVVALELVG